MQIQQPKAILFDFDDTLVSTQELIYEAVERTMAEFGLEPLARDELKKWAVKSAKDYFPKFFKEQTPEAIEFYRQQYYSLTGGMLKPMLGAIETLSFLLDHKLKPYTALVSNKAGPLLRTEVTKLGWDKFFNKIVGAGDAMQDKPSIEPLKLALLGSDIDPRHDHVWFVGDSHVDMEAANKFSCLSVLIREEYEPEWFRPYLPHLHVRDHSELLNKIKAAGL
jgi:phosphoglycolate phosphatase